MMIPLVSSNVLLVSFPRRNLAISSSHIHFDSTPISQTKLFSSIAFAKEVDKDDSFTVSYLINSCGFSSESAKLVSKQVQIKDPSTPDSVLDYLKNCGFSDAHIQKLIRSYPRLLRMNAERNLKPKMDFFFSIGIKGEDFVAIICRNPNLLSSSLDKKIIPCFVFLKRVLDDDELVVKSLKRTLYAWTGNLETNVVPNFELLKKVGVPESNIQQFFVRSSSLLGVDNVKFSERVNRVIDMGFDPSKYSFLEAIIRWPTENNWERKAQVFRSWGWSDSDISSAFRRCPNIMSTSVDKLTAVIDFLVNKMGWDPSAVAAAPNVFNYSLEKNIIPKCSVIRVLTSKGLIGEEISLNSFLSLDRKSFMERFVFRHLEQVPELLDIYEGEVDLSELGCGFGEKLGTKLEWLA